MPISKKEFKNGKLHSKLEEEIVSFLDERSDRAFTSQEIMEGLLYRAEFNTPEISKISTFTIADFATLLHHLVEKSSIQMKIVRGRMYVMAAEALMAKCPKCRTEIINPKKTWNMTGRPNKKGESIQMQIGLFQCPSHGYFRTVLNKRKILSRAGVANRGKKKAAKKTLAKLGKKTRSTKQRRGRRKTGIKTEKSRKSDAWLLA